MTVCFWVCEYGFLVAAGWGQLITLGENPPAFTFLGVSVDISPVPRLF